MKTTLILILGITLGYVAKEKLTVYQINCDTRTFGSRLITHKELSNTGFSCRNTNQVITVESNYKTILTFIKNKEF